VQQGHSAHAGLTGAEGLNGAGIVGFAGLEAEEAGYDLQVVFYAVMDFAEERLYLVVFALKLGIGLLQGAVVSFSENGISVKGKSDYAQR